jgi:hypothetical protein
LAFEAPPAENTGGLLNFARQRPDAIEPVQAARCVIRVTVECEEFDYCDLARFQGGVGGGGKRISFDAAEAPASVKQEVKARKYHWGANDEHCSSF